MMTQDYYVGKRLSYSGARCTVRYVGPVEETQGDWLGVEWDDPTRGKHSGEHQGIRYFECKIENANAASFIRPSRTPETPLSLLEALRNKYASEHLPDSELRASQQIRWGSKIVEEVGFEKIRRQQAILKELRIILLDGLCVEGIIAGSGQPNDHDVALELDNIQATCRQVIELDISRNLLRSWPEVIQICSHFDSLMSLKASGNRFSSLRTEESSKVPRHSDEYQSPVRELGLDDTLLTWSEISELSHSFPALQTLSCSTNSLRSLSSDLPPITLTSLTLENNFFEALENLSCLSGLSNLQSLYLRNNRITKSTTSKDLRPLLAESLTYLDVSYNSISTWSFVNDLPFLIPSLSGLRIAHNPLYAGQATDGTPALSVEEGFLMTIARIADLQNLNFSKVTFADRQNAELHYLSTIASALSHSDPSESSDILLHHPRYSDLCTLYGEPTIHRENATDTHPNSLAARLLSIQFQMISTADGKTSRTEKTLRIPKNWDIYRVKCRVGRAFGFPGLKSRLFWITGAWEFERGTHGNLGMYAQWERGDSGPDAEAGEKRYESDEWVQREEVMAEGTRPIGFWIDEKEARVRIETRDGWEDNL